MNGFEAGTGTRDAQGCQRAPCPNLKPIIPLIQLIAEDPVFPALDSVSSVPTHSLVIHILWHWGGRVFQAQELRSQSVGSVCTAKSPLAASRDCPLSALVLLTVCPEVRKESRTTMLWLGWGCMVFGNPIAIYLSWVQWDYSPRLALLGIMTSRKSPCVRKPPSMQAKLQREAGAGRTRPAGYSSSGLRAFYV